MMRFVLLKSTVTLFDAQKMGHMKQSSVYSHRFMFNAATVTCRQVSVNVGLTALCSIINALMRSVL